MFVSIGNVSTPPPSHGRLSLAQFDVLHVLNTGAALCGSEGLEYDTCEENIGKMSYMC